MELFLSKCLPFYAFMYEISDLLDTSFGYFRSSCDRWLNNRVNKVDKQRGYCQWSAGAALKHRIDHDFLQQKHSLARTKG